MATRSERIEHPSQIDLDDRLSRVRGWRAELPSKPSRIDRIAHSPLHQNLRL